MKNWLDTLFDRGLEAMESAENAAPPIAKPAPEVKQVPFQTRAPRDGDCGEIGVAYYSVTDGVVTMHDESGNVTSLAGQPIRYRLRDGEDPRHVASRFGKQAWIKACGESDFGRPINYGPLGIA